MSKDMSDHVRSALTSAVREVAKNVGDVSPKPKGGGKGPFSGAKGLAAGAGLAAAAPLAKKGVDAIRNGGMPSMPTLSPTKAVGNMASKAGDKVGSNLKDTVSEKVDEAGGAGGLVKEAASGLLPGGGGDGGGKGGMPGVGKGRRMPVQQSVDVAVPLETAYNQFTQFEDWPEFMHRVTRVTQEDDCSISFATKIWGKTKEFKANIETQRPDQRIKWKVSEGITHSGVVTFHELAPNLTRIEVNLDVDPGSLIEKAARGMRHVKRAVRADLARYKAFIEMQELETGAWRGVIEDGELVEPHDDEYDEERDYSDIEDAKAEAEASEDDDSDDSDDQDQDQGQDEDQDDEPLPVEELPRDRTGRFKKGAGARPVKSAASSRSSSSRSTSSDGNGSGNGKAKASSSSSSSAKRKSTARKRGSANGSGSSPKRSSGSSSTRRRSSSRS
jgi:uncharacterized membrane protein